MMRIVRGDISNHEIVCDAPQSTRHISAQKLFVLVHAGDVWLTQMGFDIVRSVKG